MMDENNVRDKLEICDGSKLTLTKVNSSKLSLSALKKFERIRYKYIIKRRKYNTFSETDLIAEDNKYDTDFLSIENLENYSFISQKSLKKMSHNYRDSERRVIIKELIMYVCLIVSLVLVDLSVLYVFNDVYKKHELHIINVWLIPVVVQVTLFNTFTYYILNLISSILMMKCLDKKNKNCLWKLIFKIFVKKYMEYYYKIHLMISKYDKDLSHIGDDDLGSGYNKKEYEIATSYDCDENDNLNVGIEDVGECAGVDIMGK